MATSNSTPIYTTLTDVTSVESVWEVESEIYGEELSVCNDSIGQKVKKAAKPRAQNYPYGYRL